MNKNGRMGMAMGKKGLEPVCGLSGLCFRTIKVKYETSPKKLLLKSKIVQASIMDQ
jgi:hypothetical protein